jgi:MOSC domain-containing protein YiiM
VSAAADPRVEAGLAGRVEALALRPAPGLPMRSGDEFLLLADGGVAGETGRGRDVTFVAVEAWTAACRALGVSVPWTARRANVLVSGLDLPSLHGREVGVGEAVVEIRGETAPCQAMEEALPGLEAALGPEGRGGVHGRVIRGGRVRVGDPVRALGERAR